MTGTTRWRGASDSARRRSALNCSSWCLASCAAPFRQMGVSSSLVSVPVPGAACPAGHADHQLLRHRFFHSHAGDRAHTAAPACASRITYLQADLVRDDWQDIVDGPVDAVISTWSLHDLGSQQNVQTVYAKSASALRGRGILLNGDFIRPDGATQVFEAGRFEVDRHLELMRQTGFKHAKCLALLEHDIESPTSAKNYACLKALRRMNP